MSLAEPVGRSNPAARITIRSGISVPSAEPPYSAAFGSWSRTSGCSGICASGMYGGFVTTMSMVPSNWASVVPLVASPSSR